MIADSESPAARMITATRTLRSPPIPSVDGIEAYQGLHTHVQEELVARSVSSPSSLSILQEITLSHSRGRSRRRSSWQHPPFWIRTNSRSRTYQRSYPCPLYGTWPICSSRHPHPLTRGIPAPIATRVPSPKAPKLHLLLSNPDIVLRPSESRR